MIYIRDMNNEDASAIASIYEDVASNSYGLLYDNKVDKIDIVGSMHQWNSNPRSIIKLLCLHDTDEIIGLAMVSPESTIFSRLSHVGELFMMISPKHQGHGYGTRMLGEVIDKAFEMGYEKIVLEVADDNKNAKALYSKFGFMNCGAKYCEIKYSPSMYVNTSLMELHKGCLNTK